jgi:hypothetical protein
MEKLIGVVKHFYPHIPAAVVELKEDLRVGDSIVIKSRAGEERFKQVVESMEVNRQQIKAGKGGEEVAIKVAGKTKNGDLVYLQS